MTIRGERAGAEVIAHVTGNREPFADRNDAENVHLFVGIIALVILRLFTRAGNIITCM